MPALDYHDQHSRRPGGRSLRWHFALAAIVVSACALSFWLLERTGVTGRILDDRMARLLDHTR